MLELDTLNDYIKGNRSEPVFGKEHSGDEDEDGSDVEGMSGGHILDESEQEQSDISHSEDEGDYNEDDDFGGAVDSEDEGEQEDMYSDAESNDKEPEEDSRHSTQSDDDESNDGSESEEDDRADGDDGREEIDKFAYRPSRGEDIYGRVIGGASDSSGTAQKYIPPAARKMAGLNEVSYLF